MRGISIRMLAVAGSLLISACASVPMTYHSAQQSNPSTKYTVEPLKDSAAVDRVERFLDSKHSVLYMQNQGGGGAAVGLLFGPLGVLANSEAIKKQTGVDADMLMGKLPVDIEKIFATSMGECGGFVQVSQSAVDPVLSPVLYVEKIDDAHIRFASLLYVMTSKDGKSTNRQYIYELPDNYTKEEIARGLTPAEMAQLSADTQIGFNWIVATYSLDVRGGFSPHVKAAIHSDFVTPRIQVALMGYSFDAGDGRLGFAMGSAQQTTVYSLPQDAGKLTM